MLHYISWREAQARVREEPVIFAEVLSRGPEGQKRYAAIRGAEDHWPPEWTNQTAH